MKNTSFCTKFCLIAVLCFFNTCLVGQEESPAPYPQENQYEKIHIPVYRAAVPFIAKIEAVTRRGASTVTIHDVDAILNGYPEKMRPWKPEDLKGYHVFLPLGEGESIDDKYYRFVANWGDAKPEKPLRVQDIHFGDHSDLYVKEKDAEASMPVFRYRPIELVKDNVIRCKFDFQPVRFRLLETPHSRMTDIGLAIPKYLDPITIVTAQLKVLINGKADGFNIHFSRDGEKWYPLWENYLPYRMLPFETLYVRIATESGEPISSASLDFEAILETHGFRGTGETVVAPVSKATGEHAKAVDCPLAFRDDQGDLILFIDNDMDEQLKTGSWFSHGSQYWPKFQGGPLGGGVMGDGVIAGPIIPAKCLGIFKMAIPKDEPGEHYFMFGFGGLNFHFTFDLPETDHSGPNPWPGFSSGMIEWDTDREYDPGKLGSKDTAPIIFDDGL